MAADKSAAEISEDIMELIPVVNLPSPGAGRNRRRGRKFLNELIAAAKREGDGPMSNRSLADKRKLAGELVEYLNGLAEIDPTAVLAIVDTRFGCNEAMANHPTVQVRGYGNGVDVPYTVGLLGILNGVVGTDDARLGFIQRIVDDEDPKAIAFCVAPE